MLSWVSGIKGDWKFKASQSCHYFIYDCEWALNSKHVKFLLCSLPILHSAWKVIFLSCYGNLLLFTYMLMPLCSFNLPINMCNMYSNFKILRFQMKSNFSIVQDLVWYRPEIKIHTHTNCVQILVWTSSNSSKRIYVYVYRYTYTLCIYMYVSYIGFLWDKYI